MKILEVLLKVPDSVENATLTELGEEIQRTLPVDCEQNGMKVEDVTFEIQSVTQKRGDFFRSIQSREKRHMVNVSSTELSVGKDDKGKWREFCLLPEGHFTCIYLTDTQVKKLVRGLRGFLFAAKVLLLFLLCAVGTMGQQLIESPKPKPNRRTFIIGVTALAAAKTADAITTRQLLNRGGWENNPEFGRHPAPARQAGINAAWFAAQSFLFYKTENSSNRYIRWIGRGYISFAIVQHAHLAACNSAIDTHGPIQNCH